MPQPNQCWFLQAEQSELVVRRTAAIGDSLAATCVASKLVELGIRVRWQAHPDLHPMLRRVPSLHAVEEPRTAPHVNLDGAYEHHPHRRRLSFADIFVTAASDQLTPRGVLLGAPTNCAPVLRVEPSERQAKWPDLNRYPRPWIGFAARSNSHANRTIPDATLFAVAQAVKGTCFWLANHAPSPAGFTDFSVRSIDSLVVALSAMDLFVGPDTGPMHIAAALKVPVIALEQASSPDLHLSDQRDFRTVRRSDLPCLNCQDAQCKLPGKAARPPCTELDAALLSDAINARLTLMARPLSVSCVIPTLRPPAERLNRCIAAILPQVDEVLVCKESKGIFPGGAMQHPKVRYVSSRQSELGYGRNANHGVRHTSGNWLLLLNDDCFLEPGAVAHLLEVAQRDARIAMVGHLLRYPDGTICHGGKYRNKGMRGWGLFDWHKRTPTIKAPREMENVTGTSVLVRRSAFYDINGFDEEIFAYCDDDLMCCALRQAGWRVWYTPHATGVHMEAQTTAASGRIGQYVNQGQAVFERRFGWYFDKNANTIPGTF